MTQREASKQDWTGNSTIADINSGSLQRIADATEKMAVNHIQLIAEVERYKRWEKEERERRIRAEKTISALRGVITKLKNKAK